MREIPVASRSRPEIRRAEIADAGEMTRLSVQLGYPMSGDEMARRLGALLPRERHCVAVAASADRLLGWMHVEHRTSLESGERAELMGLVVDSNARRSGLGRVLVGYAEQWATSRGLTSMTVRSNALREFSHPFYEALGYARAKTQHVYTKALR
jgi:GNAT superfamily N-acetyltransferase